MNDLISRNALLDELRKLTDMEAYGNSVSDIGFGLTMAVNRVRIAPAVDAVPVVRCKDCWKRGGYHCPMFFEEQTYNEDDGYDWIDRDHTSDDDFCNDGARLDGDADG